jgi:retinol-binding protein 3
MIRRSAAALALGCALIAAPAHAQTAPPGVDAAGRRMVVDSVANVLEARYADSAVAVRLGARLRERLAAGAYDAQVEPAALGAAMMRDLQGVVPDKHLRLSWEPDREYSLGGPAAAAAPPAAAGAPVGGPVRWGRIDPRDSAEIARTNFAFEAVERLPGNVGYLKLDQFVPLDFSRETAVAAMAFLANSDAVIVDLRDNLGGSPELVELILSYFYGPEPVSLVTTYGRFAHVTTERRTLREVPGRRMPGVDLYVLTSGNSASAAETFAYAVQQTHRGTVVGETSAGAGNGGAKLSVGYGLALFVPQFRVVSGPGYERTGVVPDVAASAEAALATAHRLALERLAAREAPPRVKAERAWALELLRARQAPVHVDAAQLARYPGTYGTRTIRVEDGRLVSIGATGWKVALVPLGGGVFMTPEERLRFEADAVTIEVLNGTTVRRPRQEAP